MQNVQYLKILFKIKNQSLAMLEYTTYTSLVFLFHEAVNVKCTTGSKGFYFLKQSFELYNSYNSQHKVYLITKCTTLYWMGQRCTDWKNKLRTHPWLFLFSISRKSVCTQHQTFTSICKITNYWCYLQSVYHQRLTVSCHTWQIQLNHLLSRAVLFILGRLNVHFVAG